MVNTRELSGEDRAKIWSEEIRPVFAEQFVSGKKRYFGEIGEILEGRPLSIFCNQTLDIVGDEPVLSDYGIGLSISMFPYPYRVYEGASLPRYPDIDISLYHPFIKTNHPFAKKQFASLPLFIFGVSLRDFPLSGFLTFYKILFNDKKFINDELYSKSNFGTDIYNRNHSDFTLANIAVCHHLQNQSELKEYSRDNIFALETHHVDYDEIDDLASITWDEFEYIGEIITKLEKTIPRKKTFGLF
ncbi:MAG: hypothetical protein DCC56_03895 [Anaerolineae bacterium]|nr:MAG: hypothetical protein DCC56_03895 [Anaerolineae bacterium]WKZ44009.1 MAG: hypothetical protein QY302_18080 [Anaerolineales bacterium]